MRRPPLSRRTLLRGAGGIAVALPFLEAMEAHGQTTSFPKRFIGCVNFDGTHYAEWLPTGTETSFTFKQILQPLNAFKSKLLILDGLDNEVSYNGPAPGGHDAGTAGLLSGAYTQAGNAFCGGGGCTGWGNGITIDQHIGKTVGKGDRFPTLTLSCQPKDVPLMSFISYSGPAAPVPSNPNPIDVFNKLFSGFSGGGSGGTATPDPAIERLRLNRKSVLDAVMGSMNRLNGRVSAADKVKLDQHLTAIREIERQLTTPPDTSEPSPTTTSCVRPAQPASMDYLASENFPAASKAMIDLLTIALACQMTRSVTLQWGRSVGGLTFPWLGLGGQHSISHEGDSTYGPKMTKINQWFATQFAYLLQKLDSVQEGSGTLLDNSTVFWGNSLSKGNTHARKSVPFVLAGSAGGYHRTGRFLKFGARSHTDLLVSILNSVGVPVTTFGEAKHCNGPLPGLR